MGFPARLVLFALAMTLVAGGFRLFRAERHDDRERVVVVNKVEAPALVEVIAAPAARAMVELPAPPSSAAPVLSNVRPGEIRILTTNRAAFMSLRDDRLVAGMSDSLLRHIRGEMDRELAQSDANGVGAAIGKAVVGKVSKLLGSEIEVPVRDIRDIRYERNRIVIAYRNGKPDGILNLETIKTDDDRTLLEQFSEDDARRLVAAVKARLR